MGRRICKLIYKTDPCPKPRMTQRDRWKQRPCVMRYRAFKDFLRANTPGYIEPPNAFRVTFSIAMPKSWPKKKKGFMRGKPHQQRPDLDNYLKGFCDALYEEDSGIWCVHCRKLWADEGSIELFWMPVVGEDLIYEGEQRWQPQLEQ